MKKNFVLTAIISLGLAVVSVSAQTAKVNFAGDWELDVKKSKFPETMQIESMTMKVTQTENELKVESAAKQAQGGARGGMGGMRRGGGGTQTVIYSLEGKETAFDVGSGIMAGKEKRKASIGVDGKLSLTVTRNFKTEMGDVTMKINEIWGLSDDGTILKVLRYMETPRGGFNSELYFTNKSTNRTQSAAEKTEDDNFYQGSVSNGNEPKRKLISGGVLNGKALKLAIPEYPPAARAVRASGAVNVQVTFDEQGNVVSASAVSGHPLLRQAAEEAARKSKFAPVLLGGVPIKVTGVIVFNFVP